MSNFPKPYLYLKAGCPWCEEAEGYLKKHNIEYDSVIVSGNPAAMTEMKELSGQTKAPTMKWGDEVLADFGAAELDVFLIQKGFFKKVEEQKPAETKAGDSETVETKEVKKEEAAAETKVEEPVVEVKTDDPQVPKN